jgi:hypothetical protein
MKTPKRPYEELANAIIILAVKDYRSEKRKLARKKNTRKAKHEMLKIEQFIKSKWFLDISDVRPEILLRKLHEEVF